MKNSLMKFGLLALSGTAVAYGLFHWQGTGGHVGTVYAQQKAEATEAQNRLIAHAEELSSAFREVAKSLKPSVVSIRATIGSNTIERKMRRPSIPPGLRGFEDLFGEGFDFDLPRREGMSQGSGFIVREDGYILTNNHVVADADKILVNLSDKQTLEAKIVGTDPDTDIAVIKVNARGLVPAKLGDSDRMSEGDWVIAIGNPFGLTHTVTAGIVSATHRNAIDSNGSSLTNYDNFIQTDAAINPGNSGGPLLNLRGEVIGINTAIASGSGAFNGVGFAIPSNMALDALKDIIESGKVIRGFLGAGLQEITPQLRQELGVRSDTQGVVIEQVFEEGPAAKAGLKVKDIVVAVNGKAVEGVAPMRLQIASMSPGDKAIFDIIRDRNPRKLTVTIEEQTKDKMAIMSGKRLLENLGIEVAEMSKEDAAELGVQEGMVVTRVARNSPLAGSIRPGEAIVEINRNPIRNYEDLVKALSQSKGGLRVVIRDPNSTRVLRIQ